MNDTAPSTPPRASVLAHADAKLADFAVPSAAAAFTEQGRTSHFTTFYRTACSTTVRAASSS